MSRSLIHNARVVNEGRIYMGWVLIEGDTIADCGEGAAPEALLRADDVEKTDARERLLIPGAIDTHVHFREPGLTEKADIASESRAAIAGGVTSFIDMPNTRPATTSIEAVEWKMERAAATSLANYGFFIGATADNLDELQRADYTRIAGVKLFMGSSTGGMLMDDQTQLERLFSTVDALIAVHAEDDKLINSRREAIVARYGENLEIDFHPVIRSHAVCLAASRRAVELARRYDARLHVLHISTADELSLFSAGPAAGKRITAETCPQYLALCDELYPVLGGRMKCNPAIKREADRDALRRAVADGVIDAIATDHAPHLLEQKRGTALTAASGMPMIQFSVPLMIEMVNEGIFTLPTIVERMCHNPATIFRIADRGFIRKGYKADLALIDDDCEPFTITDQWVMSRCGWTPLTGLTINVRVDTVWVNGHTAYRHGVLFSTPRSQALRYGTK